MCIPHQSPTFAHKFKSIDFLVKYTIVDEYAIFLFLGRVFKGNFKGQTVAVKRYKTRDSIMKSEVSWKFAKKDGNFVRVIINFTPHHKNKNEFLTTHAPTVHIQQNIFEKTLVEVGSPNLYASLGTFCVQIGKFFAPQWVFKHSEEFRNRRYFPSKTANCRFSNIIQRLIVPRIADQFGRKRCQKNRKDVEYRLL